MALVHLGCPTCGGALSLAEGERIVACLYCRSQSLALIPGAVPRYLVGLEVDEAAARRTAQAALERPGVPATLKGQVRFERVTLCYAPFYEATAVRMGTIFLREREKPPAPLTEGEGSERALDLWLGTPAVEREDTRVVEQDVLRVAPACRLPELGVERIPLAAARRGSVGVLLEPYDPVAVQERAVVFTPTMSAERFLEEFTLRTPAAGDRTRCAEQALKLLYYPVWRMRYRHRGRGYDIAVDGVTGGVLAGTAPRVRALVAVLTAAGAALGAFGLGRIARGLLSETVQGRFLGMRWPAGGEWWLVLLGLVALPAVWIGWQWLSEGGEIPLAPTGG
jgi:hypothetical protein